MRIVEKKIYYPVSGPKIEYSYYHEIARNYLHASFADQVQFFLNRSKHEIQDAYIKKCIASEFVLPRFISNFKCHSIQQLTYVLSVDSLVWYVIKNTVKNFKSSLLDCMPCGGDYKYFIDNDGSRSLFDVDGVVNLTYELFFQRYELIPSISQLHEFGEKVATNDELKATLYVMDSVEYVIYDDNTVAGYHVQPNTRKFDNEREQLTKFHPNEYVARFPYED